MAKLACVCITLLLYFGYLGTMTGFNSYFLANHNWTEYSIAFQNSTINPGTPPNTPPYNFAGDSETYDSLMLTCVIADASLVVTTLMLPLANVCDGASHCFFFLWGLVVLFWLGVQAGQVFVGASIWAHIDQLLAGHELGTPITLQASVILAAPPALIVAIALCCCLCWCCAQCNKGGGYTSLPNPKRYLVIEY